MARQLFTNNAKTTLSGTLAQGGTTLTCATGEGAKFPSITGGDFFYVTIYTKDVGGVEQTVEVVKVTARTGDTFTLVRDIESLTGQPGGFAYNGAVTTTYIELRWTAGTADRGLQTGDVGVTVQGYDATLAALAGVTTAADKLVYATGVDTFATTDLTAVGRALLDDADAAAQRVTLGLGNSATLNTGTTAGTVALGDHAHAGVYEPVFTTLTVPKGGTGAGTLTGLVKGNGTSAFTAAVAGTDYSAGTSALATGIVKSTTTTGALSIAAAGTDYLAPGATFNLGTTALTLNRASGAVALTGITSIDGSAATWTTARNLAGNSVNGSANVAFSNKFIVQGTVDAGLSGAQFLGALATGLVKNTTTTGVLSIAAAGTDYQAPIGTISGVVKGNGANALTAATAGTDYSKPDTAETISAARTYTSSITETPVVANTTTAYTVTDRSMHDLTLTGNCTFTFPSAASGKQFTLWLKQDATGSRTVTWPVAVRWAAGSAPTITATASKTDVISFLCDGTYWMGFVGGQNYTRA